MKKQYLVAILLSFTFLMSSLGTAHHSAIQFDFDVEMTELEGIVKEFWVVNPHSRIILEVDDEQGRRDIEYKGFPLNNYYRGGWRKGMVKEGDKITVYFAPMKDGSDGGYVFNVRASDGFKF